MNTRQSPTTAAPSRLAKSILTGSVCILLGTAFQPEARAVDGTWINDNAGTSWSDATNWLGGVIGDGADSTIRQVFFPTYNATGTTTNIAGFIILDGARTVGHLLMEDLDNFGSSHIFVVNNGTSRTLTFDTTSGMPTVLVGQNLNSGLNTKIALLDTVIVAGNDGLRKAGPGYLALRQAAGAANNHTFTGELRVEGGVLQLASQTVYAGQTLVSGGATLHLDFFYSTAPMMNPINPASPLVLGSDGSGGVTRGGGVITNANLVMASTVGQTWSSTTLNEGTHQFRLATNSGQNLIYNLGPVTRHRGATVDFSRAFFDGTVTVNANIANGANGILGGWAVFTRSSDNVDWAINNGANVIAGANFALYSQNAFGPSRHSNLTLPAAVASVPDGTVTNTIRINNSYSLTVGLAGRLTVETGGILAGLFQSPAFNGGTLTTGEINGELILHSYAGGTGLRIGSNIADNGATPLQFIKAGTGQVTLTANNTYTGTTYVGAGVLQIGNGWGGGTTGALGAGDVFLNGFNNNAFAYSPSGTLLFNRAGTFTVTNNVSGSGNIAQAANGTLVLNKQFNVRNLQGFAGTVRMDFDAAGAPASEIINSIESVGTGSLATAWLQLRDSKLEILGKTGVATTQSFALTVATGAARIAVTPGAGGTVTLNLGALGKFHDSTEGGGTLRLDIPGGVTVTAPNGGSAGQTQQNGIIVDLNTPWVTVGDNDWAAKDATIIPGTATSSLNIVAGSTRAGFYKPSSAGVFSGNLDIDNSPAIAATSVLSSMRFNAPGANTVTIGAGAVLEPHGILVGTGVGAANVTIAGAGTIRGTDDGGATARDFPIIQNNTAGDLVISVPIVNFDANTRTTLVKSGQGTLLLRNGGAGTVTHTYTDRTIVNEGVLKVGAGALLGTTGARAGSILIRGGSVVVEGTGRINTGSSTWIGQRIGEDGTLTVKDSGIFDATAELYLGFASARGTLNVQDSAQLLVKRFYVGVNGFAEGFVNLSGNGQILAANTPDTEWTLGGRDPADPTARGTMNQSGATFFNLANVSFQIGRYGIGEYNLTGGAVSGTGIHSIGRFLSGVGGLNISSSGSWNANPGGAGANYFIVGESGLGTLTLGVGGSLIAKNLSLAHAGGVGVVNLNGGTIDLQNTAAIGAIQAGVVFGQTAAPSMPLPGYGGTLHLNGGTLKTFGIRENPAATTPVSSIVTFDGGTVQAKGTNAAFMQGLNAVIIEDSGGIVDTNGFNITIAQPLTHDAAGPALDGGIEKTGVGVLTLSGLNTYTGPTNVLAGTLSITNRVAGAVNVSAGATLIGTGTIGGAVDVVGTFAPGLSPGALTLLGGDLTLHPTATSNFELGGTGVGQYDEVNGIGAFVLDGIFSVSSFGGFNPGLANTFDLVDFTTINAAGFNVATDLVLPPLDPGLAWDSSNFTTDGSITVVTVIPEPGAATLLLLGALSLAARRRR